jgi:hypothetical protein
VIIILWQRSFKPNSQTISQTFRLELVTITNTLTEAENPKVNLMLLTDRWLQQVPLTLTMITPLSRYSS